LQATGYGFVSALPNKPNLDYCVLALDVVKYMFELNPDLDILLASNKVSLMGSKAGVWMGNKIIT